MKQTHYSSDNEDLIKRAIVQTAMPVPFKYRCKYEGSCNIKNTYFDRNWILPYSDRMKGKMWTTTYRKEETCCQDLWILLLIVFICFLIF